MICVITHNDIIGCHAWNSAPEKYAYLRDLHRHVFEVRCVFEVSHTDRDIELNDMQETIDKAFHGNFVKMDNGLGVYFGGMSCEDIAQWCINEFGCVECEVLEDGFGGAIVRK